MFQKMLQVGSGGSGGIDLTAPKGTAETSSIKQSIEVTDSSYKSALVLVVTNDSAYNTYAYVTLNGESGTKLPFLSYKVWTSSPPAAATIVYIPEIKVGDVIFIRGMGKVLFY